MINEKTIYYSGRKGGLIDKYLIETFFNYDNGTLMECGALDGEYLSIGKVFEVELNWKCINIEADPNTFPKLVINRPKSINLHYVLSDNDNDNRKFLSSIKKPKQSGVNPNGIDLPSITYKKVIEENKIDKIDLFILHVEGHEEFVIKGMNNCNILPKIIVMETFFDWNRDKLLGKLNEVTNNSYKFHKDISYNSIFIKEKRNG